MYTISDVAEQLNMKPHTLRYYEKEGIIVPDRNSQGIRNYQEDHIKWLQFIKKLRETQMPIAQIKEYVRLLEEGGHTAIKRLELLENHRTFIQNQIKDLIRTDEMLERKVTIYKEMIGVSSGEEN